MDSGWPATFLRRGLPGHLSEGTPCSKRNHLIGVKHGGNGHHSFSFPQRQDVGLVRTEVHRKKKGGGKGKGRRVLRGRTRLMELGKKRGRPAKIRGGPINLQSNLPYLQDRKKKSRKTCLRNMPRTKLLISYAFVAHCER